MSDTTSLNEALNTILSVLCCCGIPLSLLALPWLFSAWAWTDKGSRTIIKAYPKVLREKAARNYMYLLEDTQFISLLYDALQQESKRRAALKNADKRDFTK